ncbi:MAG: hypothetical protein H0X30_02290 [Anaerolineae bacterium]|nr:hypothetical protein [Anaerolineae bacterium]
MSNSNSQWNNNCINPSQRDNPNRDVDQMISQGDAIYDYERAPAAWNGFDEQPTIYQYGDSAAWQNNPVDEAEKRAS